VKTALPDLITTNYSLNGRT